MSDTNSPGLPGAEDPGDPSWPEYLTSGEAHGATPAGAEPEGRRAPHRVIGTPPPAAARTLLPGEAAGRQPAARELPAEPENPASAKRAERVVAACFLLAMVAGFGFLVAYAIIGVGSMSGVLHSNLVLGSLPEPGLPAARGRRDDLGQAPDARRRDNRAAPPDAVG